jgi:Zn-finger nucleic acid-binding protein
MTAAPFLNSAPMALRCPKCAAEMVTYERSGIHLDQCRECRGIYLDRGELERLVDAESGGAGWAGRTMNAPVPVPLPRAADSRYEGRPGPEVRPGPERRPDPERRARANPIEALDYLPEWFGDGDRDDWSRQRDDRGAWDDRRDRDGRDRPQKRRGFLGELLEGFGD